MFYDLIYMRKAKPREKVAYGCWGPTCYQVTATWSSCPYNHANNMFVVCRELPPYLTQC